jgi:predicted ribosomally synthesized peptide with SipW-like signal peptide
MTERKDSKARRLTLSLLIVGVVGAIVGVGTLSAFSSSTSNTGNNFDAGTVYITDNDAGSALYNVTNRKPGDTVTSCIKVTYGGTLGADVHLYTASTINAVGQYIDLTIEKGTSSGNPAFPGCGTFTSEATVYNGTLSGFASAHNDYASGSSVFPGSQTVWNPNDTLVYRFTVSLQDNNNANGQGAGALTSGSHTFTWEARNQ